MSHTWTKRLLIFLGGGGYIPIYPRRYAPGFNSINIIRVEEFHEKSIYDKVKRGHLWFIKSNIEIVAECRRYFQFNLPSELGLSPNEKKKTKFEENYNDAF